MYIAAGYMAAIPYFVVLFPHHHTSMDLMHLVSFGFVALELVVVTLGVYQHLHEHGPALVQVASVATWQAVGPIADALSARGGDMLGGL